MTLKITVSKLEAKQLRDTGSWSDPQDPSVTLKIGQRLYTTNRQKDAGVNASYPEVFTIEIDPTIINNENFLEVEVWNISEPSSRNSVMGTKSILVGRGKVTLFDLLNEIIDDKKAISIKLSFTTKSSSSKVLTSNIEAGLVEFQLSVQTEETSPSTDTAIDSKFSNDSSDHESSLRDWSKLDEKSFNVNLTISEDLASMDLSQQPLKLTIYDLKAKQLRNTGSVTDPQDPSVTLKLGTSSSYSTSRQRDAGTNAAYKERFTVEIDPTKMNTSNFLEVEVWNISESGSFISKKKLVGSGKMNLFDILNNFKDRKKAVSVKLSFADKSNSTEIVEAGVVDFQLFISAPRPEISHFSADTNLHAYKLNISNLCVQNLPAANGDSKTSDPYVHLSLRTMDEAVVIDVGKTTHKQRSNGNETWKETFTTYIIEKDSSLMMEIFDWNQINNHESMGFVTLQLSEYLTDSPTTGVFSIQDIEVQNQGRFKGSATLSICLEVEMVKPSEAFRKSISPNFDEALINVADDGLINRLYDAHYADLRKSREEIELLRTSTSIENKKTILLESKRGNANKWGDKESKLVEKFKTSPQIDVCDLVDLETLLKDADIYMLGSFFKEHGVTVLLSILDRLSLSPEDLDALIMMQTLRCLKAIMGDTAAVGMEGLLAAQNLMPCIISCLIFEYKALALLAMEMLRLCSVYNPKSSKKAISSALSRSTPSDLAPCFEKLCDGLNRGDIEVKTAVLKLVNSMVYQAAYFKEIKMHNEVRNELQRHKFETLVKKAMNTINQESSKLDLTSDPSTLHSLSICVGHTKVDRPPQKHVLFSLNRTSSAEESEHGSVHLTRSSTSRKSFLSFDSKRSIADNRSESEHADTSDQSFFDENSPESKSPAQEIMSGFLWVESKGKWSSVLKERHHVLSTTGFHVYHGPDKPNKLKASYSIGSIGKVKEFTSIAAFRGEKRPLFSLLINGKEFAFACNNTEEKDRWVQHFHDSIRQYLFTKAKSKRNLQIVEDSFTVQKVLNYIAEFGNQYSIYERMMFGNRENIIHKSGVNWDDIYDVSRFLIAEAVASGNTESLLRIFQQLLLIPVESEGLWSAIPTGLEKLLQICKTNTIPSGDIFDEDFRAVNVAFSGVNIKEQLLKKAEDGGEPYAELHNLALFAVRAEKNNEILSRRIKELEAEVRKLEEVQGIPETKSYLRPHEDDDKEEVPPVEESEEMQKYRRFENMKKVGNSDMQIRQMMVSSNKFTVEEIDAFLAGTIVQAKKNADMDSAEEERQERLNRLEKDLNEARLLPRAAADNLLSVFQDRIHSYEKTFKISKKDVNDVRKHMQRDHCTKEEENNLCKLLQKSLKPVENSGLKAPSIPISDNSIPVGMEEKPKIRTKYRLQPFFWTKVPSAEIPGTMWHMLQEYPTHEVAGLEDNICEWFSTSAAAAAAPAAAKQSDTARSLPALDNNPEKQPETLISLLPSEKNRTVMIVLKQLKLKPDDLMELVIRLDPTTLNESITESLLGILPVSEELEKAKGYPDPKVLDLTGQFMWHFRRIPNVGERLEFHSTCFTWFSVASSLDEQVAVLNMACATMSASSDKLQKLFSIILGIGNYINGGTRQGQAYGFTVKTLQKLSEYKTKYPLAYGKTTRGSLVDFIVEHITSTNNADNLTLLDLGDELSALSKAVPISLVEMRDDLSKLESGIQHASVELARIDTDSVFMGLDGAQEARDGPLTNALYQRLELFVQDSKSKMAALKAHVAETENTVNKLAAYYVVLESANANADEEENADRKEPHQKVFGFISDFLHAMKSTYTKAENYRASVRLKERQERDRANLLKAKRKKTEVHPPLPPPRPDDERVDELQVDNSTELDTSADESTLGGLMLPLTVPVFSDAEEDADREEDAPAVMTSLRSPRVGAPALIGDLFDQLNAIDDLNIFADAVGDNYQRILDEAEAEAEEVGVKMDSIS